MGLGLSRFREYFQFHYGFKGIVLTAAKKEELFTFNSIMDSRERKNPENDTYANRLLSIPLWIQDIHGGNTG